MPNDDSTKGALDFSRKNEPSIPQGKSYLLAIGINEYEGFSKLNNAVKDAQDIAALLAENYGFEAEKPLTRLLLNAEASRRDIINSLKELCRILQPNDRVLIYYSGHGYLDPVTKLGFWIPADAERDDDSSYLPNSAVRDYIKAMRCRHILLISDSCFSGELLVRDATRRIEGAFADWERQRSRWVFCSGKGVVSDGKAGSNSPFAAQIIRCLREQGSTQPINLHQLADAVTRSVRFNYEQQAEACPLFGVGHEGGQFIFYPKRNEEEERRLAHDDAYRRAKQTPPSISLLSDFLEKYPASPHKAEIRSLLRDAEEERIWRRVNKNSVASLDEYLDESPYGKYAAEARQRIERIKAERRQEQTEKLSFSDMATRQEAEEKQRKEDELQKKKEIDQRRYWELLEAEEANKQLKSAILEQQDQDISPHQNTDGLYDDTASQSELVGCELNY